MTTINHQLIIVEMEICVAKKPTLNWGSVRFMSGTRGLCQICMVRLKPFRWNSYSSQTMVCMMGLWSHAILNQTKPIQIVFLLEMYVYIVAYNKNSIYIYINVKIEEN